MQHWKELLTELGSVQSFEYPYMREGRRSPDRLAKLIDAHRAQLEGARSAGHEHVVLIGKSMGGRVGCHLATQQLVSAVVCLGYPLKGMGAKGKLRDQVLLELQVPILFVQGTRDNLCPLDLLESVRIKMQCPNDLHVVETGDHSLLATKTWLKQQQLSQDDVDRRSLTVIEEFLRRHAS